MLPVSRTTVSTLFAISAHPRSEPIASGRGIAGVLPAIARPEPGWPSDGHDLHVVRLTHPLLFLRLQLLLDTALVVVAHLVHADGALGPAGEELADDRVLAVLHVLLAVELHQPGAEEDPHELGRAHHRRNVVG